MDPTDDDVLVFLGKLYSIFSNCENLPKLITKVYLTHYKNVLLTQAPLKMALCFSNYTDSS